MGHVRSLGAQRQCSVNPVLTTTFETSNSGLPAQAFPRISSIYVKIVSVKESDLTDEAHACAETGQRQPPKMEGLAEWGRHMDTSESDRSRSSECKTFT